MLRVEALTRLHVGPLSFEIGDGECVALQGASGAGKSLLLRAIADLDPHGGEVLVDGLACSRTPAPRWRRLVGCVPAEPGWWSESVAAHFERPPDGATLAATGLDAAVLERPVSRLSTGERQRLALLRCVAREPRALLLDEPTAALDPDSRDRVEALLRERLDDGVSLLLVSHDPAQAARLAGRMLRLRDGRIEPAQP